MSLRGKTQKRARESAYLCTHPVRIVSIRLSIRRRSKNLHHLICVAATSRPELVFFLVFKTSVGTQDVVGYCDCRHVCDDEESHQTLGTEDCLVMFSLASSMVGLYDLVSVCVVSPFCQKKRRNFSFHLLLCQILPCRTACLLVRVCVFSTGRPRGSAPRSFSPLCFCAESK